VLLELSIDLVGERSSSIQNVCEAPFRNGGVLPCNLIRGHQKAPPLEAWSVVRR
jgi:hypothetical protein